MKNLMSQTLALAPDWVVASFPIVRIVLVCIIALCGILMIISTLMQSNANDEGSTALTGGAQESYYAQNKGQTRDAKLAKVTVACISIMAVCMVLFFVSLIIYQG